MSETLRRRLMVAEGKRNHLYRDTAEGPGFEGKPGYVTIGIGYNIDKRGLPDDIINLLFERDMLEAHLDVRVAFPWTKELDEARREVLEEMCFNMGIEKLKAFKATLGALQRREYTEAAGHLRDSLAYRQLPKRYEALAKIIETGEV